eukprot:COSAG01_NODE_34_length_34978_cov_45.798475_38_plen_187_part_00
MAAGRPAAGAAAGEGAQAASRAIKEGSGPAAGAGISMLSTLWAHGRCAVPLCRNHRRQAWASLRLAHGTSACRFRDKKGRCRRSFPSVSSMRPWQLRAAVYDLQKRPRDRQTVAQLAAAAKRLAEVAGDCSLNELSDLGRLLAESRVPRCVALLRAPACMLWGVDPSVSRCQLPCANALHVDGVQG